MRTLSGSAIAIGAGVPFKYLAARAAVAPMEAAAVAVRAAVRARRDCCASFAHSRWTRGGGSTHDA